MHKGQGIASARSGTLFSKRFLYHIYNLNKTQVQIVLKAINSINNEEKNIYTIFITDYFINRNT
jgi:hypothetical protein